MANTSVVPPVATYTGETTSHPPTSSGSVTVTTQTRTETPSPHKAETDYLSCIRERLQVKGFSADTIDIILGSWRKGTQTQYQSVAKRWFEFCNKRNCDVISPPLPLAMSFLSELFQSGLSYSYINTARSTLSSLLIYEGNLPFGQLPIVKRFIKGVFEARPALPRYSSTWDVNVAFTYIRKQDPVDLLSLKDLSHRLAFLLCLLSGQRCQTINKLSLQHMSMTDSKVMFIIFEKLKHTRAGVHQKPLEFLAYPINQKLCILTHLKVYLEKTKMLRIDEKQLLISYIKPHKAVSCETISKWVKKFMAAAGIDTSIYKSHTTRSASTSSLAGKQSDIQDIMNAAGWTKEETFQKFYKRDIFSPFNFGRALLDANL